MPIRFFTLASVLAAATLAALVAPAQADSPTFGGCISETGTGGACTDSVALDDVSSVTVSPDGKNAYAASAISDAVITFNRNTTTGALTPAGCISETGTGGACTDSVALDRASSVAVSPDGKNVYAASDGSDAVVVFNRSTTTGALTFGSCISETGTSGACTDSVALDGASSVTVSPDGNNIYVASVDSDAVVVFARNTTTGALTPVGCISQTGTGGACGHGVALDGAYSVTVSPDGKNAYVASRDSDAVAIFTRTTTNLTYSGCISEDGTGGSCIDGVALDYAYSVTVSPDGKNVYASSYFSEAVVTFTRNTTTGALTPAGCISTNGTSGACTTSVALGGPVSVTISPDGKRAYVAALGSHAVDAFTRNTSTGALTPAGCISEDGTSGHCIDGVALVAPQSVAVSPDGNNAYVATLTSNSVVALNLRTEVFRFWSPRFNNAHFYTADPTEANNLKTDPNWSYEGIAFKVRDAVSNSCAVPTTPVYRFYSSRFASHFYTAIASEANNLKTDPNWSYEGVTYCAFSTHVPGTTALYRFWSPVFNKHFFTAVASEVSNLNTDSNWSSEGIAYYVLP